MGKPPEKCWYCRERRPVLWCDFMLGSVLVQPEPEPAPEIKLSAPPTPVQAGLFDLPAPAEIIAAPVPKHAAAARAESAKLDAVKTGAATIATCDAAACGPCAKKHGWRRVGHICGRPKVSQTIDHCHVHVATDAGLGSSAWIGVGGIELARREVRVACARAGVQVARG